MIPLKHKGAHSELVGCTWLLSEGYDVFRNVSPHGPVDVVAIKDGILHFFEIRTSKKGSKSKLRPDQMNKGIKIINVELDGSCSIDENPVGQKQDAFLRVDQALRNSRKPERVSCAHCDVPLKGGYVKIRAQKVMNGLRPRNFCSMSCHNTYYRGGKHRQSPSGDPGIEIR